MHLSCGLCAFCLFIYLQVFTCHGAGTWSTASLSVPRSFLASTCVGNLALFGGGLKFQSRTIDLFSDIVDIYNISSHTWSTTYLSEERGFLAATSVDGDVALFAGGQNTVYYSATVDIYSLSTNSWTTATLSEARSELAAASVQGRAIFAGGFRGTEGSSMVVDIYHHNFGKTHSSSSYWTVSSLSEARREMAAASILGTNMALFGGGAFWNIGSSKVDIYSASTNRVNDSWTTSALSANRSYLAATSVGETLALFAGGVYAHFANVTFLSVVDIYDVKQAAWSRANLSQARCDLTATSVGGKLAMFAGGQIAAKPFDRIDIFNATSGSWSTASLSQPRFYLTATSIRNVALFAGGEAGSGSKSSVVDIYTWSQSEPRDDVFNEAAAATTPLRI